MAYEQQVLEILMKVGSRGIKVGKLSKHVYNMNCTLFSQPDLQTIHQYVQQYLLRNSKTPQSLIEHMDRRGYYRLNTKNSSAARQLLIDFSNDNTDQKTDNDDERPHADLSLSLFEGF